MRPFRTGHPAMPATLLALALAVAGSASAQAACKVSSRFSTPYTPVAGQKHEASISALANIESRSGHWLRNVKPTVSRAGIGRGSVDYLLVFDIRDNRFCREDIIVRLVGSCRFTLNRSGGGSFGTSNSFDVTLPGRNRPSQQRDFTARLC